MRRTSAKPWMYLPLEGSGMCAVENAKVKKGKVVQCCLMYTGERTVLERNKV